LTTQVRPICGDHGFDLVECDWQPPTHLPDHLVAEASHRLSALQPFLAPVSVGTLRTWLGMVGATSGGQPLSPADAASWMTAMAKQLRDLPEAVFCDRVAVLVAREAKGYRPSLDEVRRIMEPEAKRLRTEAERLRAILGSGGRDQHWLDQVTIPIPDGAERWLRDTDLERNGEVVTLRCRSPFSANWIANHFDGWLRQALGVEHITVCATTARPAWSRPARRCMAS